MPFRNLFDRVAEFYEGSPGRPVIGFFAGCSITYLYPEIGEHMVAILRRLGYGVFIPRSQRCCGIPALSTGNGRLVAELADSNVAAFAARQVEQIVTACASCHRGTHEHYAGMQGNYGDFAGKVVDFSVFLQQNGFLAKLAAMTKRAERLRVTYHDPCHLKTQGVTKEPRELLKALPQVDFIEMDDAALCCGLGGTFSASHYQESKAIGAKKVAGLKDSGAALVATACPGCIMQLQDIINHAGLKMKAVHILELVAEAAAVVAD
jgi:glycolate oxidase iron-sulfur subunit